MYEIELKAHVKDKKLVIEKLNTFAQFLENVKKEDTYWGTFKDEGNSTQRKIQARIRKETKSNGNAESATEKFIFTYKRKENRNDQNGNAYEVNEEKECDISERDAIEAFFEDIGLQILLKKEKTVSGWQFGECHIELCNVPPLGDFLEIEIISEKNDEKTVAEKKSKLLDILKRCEIEESKIENRYYSEMLRELK